MRRQKYIDSKKQKIKKNSLLYIAVLSSVPILVSAFAFLFFKLFSLEKYSFVYRDKNKDTYIYIVDTKNDMAKKYFVNGNILLDSSRSLGEYSLENLWVLAEKEKIGGELVTKSIVKNFNLPIFYYLNGRDTNMDLYHLIKSRVTISKKYPTDAEINSFLISKSILVDFVDLEVQEGQMGVEITDLTGNSNISEQVSIIINNLGSKVTNFSRGSNDDNLDCEIVSKKEDRFVSMLKFIFDCEVKQHNEDLNYIKLRIGEKFVERF